MIVIYLNAQNLNSAKSMFYSTKDLDNSFVFYIFDISRYFSCKQNIKLMKTLVLTQKQAFKTFSFIGMLLLTMFAVNPVYAQTTTTTETANNERTIKGVISNEEGPLKDVNITQEGTRNGTVTNANGEFTFPVKLKTGDVLTISYIGYETQQVKIKDDTTFLKVVLTEDLIEMIGALDSGKPYKSKRNKN